MAEEFLVGARMTERQLHHQKPTVAPVKTHKSLHPWSSLNDLQAAWQPRKSLMSSSYITSEREEPSESCKPRGVTGTFELYIS